MNIKNPNSDKVHLTWTNLIINIKVKHSCLSSKYRFQHFRSKRIEEGCQLRQCVFASFCLSNFDNKVKLDGHFRYIWESWFSLIIINGLKDPFTDYETINFCWPFDIPSTFGSSSPRPFILCWTVKFEPYRWNPSKLIFNRMFKNISNPWRM